MKSYTIVRNGVINQQPKGDHKCGYARTRRYPYRVELTVKGELRAPDYFIVANEMIDEIVQARFVHQPSTSCERMCDDICGAVLAYMGSTYADQWQVLKCHTELTGTNGRALLSCDWHHDGDR
jgi:hypothetical protein